MDPRCNTHVYSCLCVPMEARILVCVYAYVCPEQWSELHSVRCFQVRLFILSNILYSIKGPHGRKNEEQKKERVSYSRMKYDCRDADIPVCESIGRTAK
jgi:hypothetical protein